MVMHKLAFDRFTNVFRFMGATIVPLPLRLVNELFGSLVSDNYVLISGIIYFSC